MVREATLAWRRDVPVRRGPTQDIATGVLDMPDFPVGRARARACASHPRSLAPASSGGPSMIIHFITKLDKMHASARIVLQYPVKVPIIG